ncbi:MAG: putative mucin/carbohydrate-binding domain-containing protein, partial [Sarcina sp.]
PQPRKLPNIIIVKADTSGNKVVSTIEFNADDKKLIIASTGLVPRLSPNPTLYFSLKLKDSNNQRLKEISSFTSNENANKFTSDLNGKRFEYGDILELDYLVPRNIAITNFPTTPNIHIPTKNKEYYRITPQGLQAYTPPTPPPPEPNKLPNTIIVKANPPSRGAIATIEFNTDDEELIVNSTNVIADSSLGSDVYFSLKLKDSNNQNIKESSIIIANETADNLENFLNNQEFEYGDILELDYLIPANITITNFPNTPQNYTPTNRKEFYRITPQGLQAYTPPTPPPPEPNKLPNSIIIRNTASPKEIVATIEFNTDDDELMVTSTGIIPDRQFNNIYFSLKLKDNNNQNIKVDSTILGTQNADNFENDLNGENFEYGDILELDYFIPNNITITNFPNAPQNYTPTNRKEFYRITPQGLQAYTPPTPPPPGPNKLPNAIIVANTDVSTPRPTVATIEFNTDDETLIVTSTGEIPRIPSTSPIYFSLKLKDS